jgi:hypothetical protein
MAIAPLRETSMPDDRVPMPDHRLLGPGLEPLAHERLARMLAREMRRGAILPVVPRRPRAERPVSRTA